MAAPDDRPQTFNTGDDVTTETVEQTIPTTFRFEDIPLSKLIAHPGNVREDLQVTDRFRRSIRKKLRTPLLVTPQPDGTYKVIDGHRRLLVMIEDEWETVPGVIDDSRADDEAGQFLDMVTTADQRVGLNNREKAAALFSASELGADAKTMASETGWTQKEVKTAVHVGGATKVVEAAKGIEYDWTLDQLAAMVEFENDPEALAALAESAKHNNFTYRLRRLRDDREEATRLAKEREEFAAAGITIIDKYELLPEKATPVDKLRTVEGKRITDQEHQECRGHAMAPGEYNNDWRAYCLKPGLYDHKVYTPPSGTGGAKPDKAARQRTIQGNKDYKAATEARRMWLKEWVTRKTFPKQGQEIMARYVARALVYGGDFVTGGINSEDHRELLCDWLGLSNDSAGDEFAAAVAKADVRRLPVIAFMSVVAACEKTAGHKSNRGWRTDGGGYETRTRARISDYFAVLASLGHKVTPVEQAVIDGKAYDGTAQALKELQAREKREAEARAEKGAETKAKQAEGEAREAGQAQLTDKQ